MSDSPRLKTSVPGTAAADPGAALTRRVRVRKEDSAFVYAVFEAHEGVLSYTTLDHRAGDLHRDLELSIPAGLADEARRILEDLGEMIYELD
jgi:hypothetical protein